jgi:1-acyl-sn-glycerol-3-phosphate acyltransferase
MRIADATRWRKVPDLADPFAERSPVLLALFRWYLHFLFWRRFSAVRLSRGGIPELHGGRPLVIYTNHPSWWDPALFMLVSPKLFPGRLGFGPMDAAQLQRYGLFRKFGVFGVDGGARGAAHFLRLARRGLREARAIMWITAEGAFRDPRLRPVHLRPGIAHLARHAPDTVFLPMALDYVFWNESRPEALLRFGAPVHLAGLSLADAQAALETALTGAMDGLAQEAATRDAARFLTLLNGTAGTGLIYDSWRRLRALARGRRFSARHELGPP